MSEMKELWAEARELVGEQELTRRYRIWIGNLIRVKRGKGADGKLENDNAEVLSVLADLNARSGRRFTSSPQTARLILKRLKEGWMKEDFFRVNEVKCTQWIGDEVMEPFLRPSTLYAPSHFEEYLAEWYALDKSRKEKISKVEQQSTIKKETGQQEEIRRAEESAVTTELMAKPWDKHESWAELMLWTMKFPTAEALSGYTMPERIQRMRLTPKMCSNVIMGRAPEWAEKEYQELKQKLGEARAANV